ncbi:hypothetical protein LCGC14_0596920 [marine sediment metagenome]|uniref:Uncharacterized protein n=1 Tax=marine sediment metagenome TaxID=412755 RepID=A0A0F9RGM9_9ZZZZ
MANEKSSILEKLKDVLSRNYNTLQIEISYLEKMKFNILHFKIHTGFNYHDLVGIFRYWGIDWKFHIYHWNVESNNNFTVRVSLFIIKDVKCEDNKHDIRPYRNWGKNAIICNKCGLFNKTKEE